VRSSSTCAKSWRKRSTTRRTTRRWRRCSKSCSRARASSPRRSKSRESSRTASRASPNRSSRSLSSDWTRSCAAPRPPSSACKTRLRPPRRRPRARRRSCARRCGRSRRAHVASSSSSSRRRTSWPRHSSTSRPPSVRCRSPRASCSRPSRSPERARSRLRRYNTRRRAAVRSTAARHRRYWCPALTAMQRRPTLRRRRYRRRWHSSVRPCHQSRRASHQPLHRSLPFPRPVRRRNPCRPNLHRPNLRHACLNLFLFLFLRPRSPRLRLCPSLRLRLNPLPHLWPPLYRSRLQRTNKSRRCPRAPLPRSQTQSLNQPHANRLHLQRHEREALWALRVAFHDHEEHLVVVALLHRAPLLERPLLLRRLRSVPAACHVLLHAVAYFLRVADEESHPLRQAALRLVRSHLLPLEASRRFRSQPTAECRCAEDVSFSASSFVRPEKPNECCRRHLYQRLHLPRSTNRDRDSLLDIQSPSLAYLPATKHHHHTPCHTSHHITIRFLPSSLSPSSPSSSRLVVYNRTPKSIDRSWSLSSSLSCSLHYLTFVNIGRAIACFPIIITTITVVITERPPPPPRATRQRHEHRREEEKERLLAR